MVQTNVRKADRIVSNAVILYDELFRKERPGIMFTWVMTHGLIDGKATVGIIQPPK